MASGNIGGGVALGLLMTHGIACSSFSATIVQVAADASADASLNTGGAFPKRAGQAVRVTHRVRKVRSPLAGSEPQGECQPSLVRVAPRLAL